MLMGGSSLRDLARLRNYRAKRCSSWDTTGGNRDYWLIKPGETKVLAETESGRTRRETGGGRREGQT